MRLGKMLHALLFVPRCAGCGKRIAFSPQNKDLPVFCPDCGLRWQRAMQTQCPECFCAYADCRCAGSALQKAGCESLLKLACDNDPDAHAVRNTVLYLKDHPSKRTFGQLALWLRDGLLATLEKSGCKSEDAVIVYLPRSPKAKRRAGMDQARELARALSCVSGIAFQTHLVKHRSTKQQKTLTRAQRQRNIQNSLEVVGEVRGRTVILVDDVVTTAATMCAGSKLLRAAGAARIIGVCVARTERTHKSKA